MHFSQCAAGHFHVLSHNASSHSALVFNITLQILLSCCHTLLIAETGRIS